VETAAAPRVYGAFVAATDDAVEAIDILLTEGPDAHLRDLSRWEDFRQARHRFDAAWGQVRLVAPASLAEHAQAFVVAARRDLKVEAEMPGNWLRR